MDMGYSGYDTYNNQVGFPISRRQSMYSHPGVGGDYGYDQQMGAGVYGEVSIIFHNPSENLSDATSFQNYPQPAYPIYTPSRQLSQYTPARECLSKSKL
ncbi:hypothetical protein PHLCEN_2v10758 [Hermanssonia centrifuga]|uniref:Uncharacterized protein n=1 Tax=Hermanssonia centrifuga TaxID=98765 RepID=A0A2R6NME7_9APHY|nr:hypothetical protein PHLCEN_2v10758 [Hermanssonia centrifuga]